MNVAPVRNITDLNLVEEKEDRLRDQLQDTQKMEAIATLAGGVAHQFNNALVGITANIELLKMDFPDNEKIAKYIEPMKTSAHRMTHLTNQLLAYAQGGKYQPETISLSDFLEKSIPLIRHGINPVIRLETDIKANIPNVKADITQIQMVVSAVVTNAEEALEGPGRIRIITRDEDVGDDFAKLHRGLKPGSYVCLVIEDNGKGMDEETRDKIFDPFFTTKFQGRGLGMAAVYGIVKNHGGYISVDSELGRGTVIRIYLPAVDVPAAEKKMPIDLLTRGSGTILIIEDEEIVMDVSRTILERLGYRVMEAKTGMEAIDITRNFDGDIDLAILDIVLPDMGGKGVYSLMKEARPDLKVIVCSGYTIDGPAQEILNAGAQGFLQKPYSLAILSAKLKEALDGK